MGEELARLVKSLNAAELTSFKRQLASLSEEDKRRTFSQLTGIPELADIVGSKMPTATKVKAAEIPLWQKGLETATAPFRWIEQNITQPFGAIVTSPFTPTVAGTENLPWYQRELAEYRGWQEPTFTMPWGGRFRPIKGLVETLPWLAIPSAGGIIGRLGPIAAKGGALGRGAALLGKALTPAATIESLPGKALGELLAKAGRGVLPSKVWKELAVTDRVALSKEVGLEGKVGSKSWAGLTQDEKKIISNRILKPEVTLVTPEIKEPWQMTQKEYLQDAIARQTEPQKKFFGEITEESRDRANEVHRTVVTQALEQGKTIPPEVLKDYPDLAIPKAEIGVPKAVKVEGVTFPVVDIGQIKEQTPAISKLVRQGKLIKYTDYTFPITKTGYAIANPNIKAEIQRIQESLRSLREGSWTFAPESYTKVKTRLEGQLKEMRISPEVPTTPITEVATIKAPPPIKPPTKPITSELFPEGFEPSQQVAIKWLIDFAKKLKPLRKETEELYTMGRATQAKAYESAMEKAIKEGATEVEAARRAKQAMYVGGELPKAQLPAGVATEAEREAERMGEILYGISRTAPYESVFDRLNINNALTRLLDPATAGLPRDFEFKLLEKTFGSELVKELLKKRPLSTRAWELVIDIANAPRALLASCDISGLLRQGVILIARRPIEGIKTVGPMLKSIFADRNAELMDSIIRSRAGMDELLHPKVLKHLDLTPLPSKVATKFAEKEEPFISTVLNKIPFIKASNRAYVTGLNDLRSRSALSKLNAWKRAGLKFDENLEYGSIKLGKYGVGDISDLNQMVNWASGRGDIPFGLNRQGGLLNAFFFAPKLFFSRVEFPTTILPSVTKSALVRAEAWRTLLTFIGAGAGILTMAKLSGVGDIEIDPRSADFAKLKVGETRLDIWTGYAQYMRFLAQLATAQRKTVGGRIQQLNRRDILMRFAQTKLSPAAGLINDILQGETYLGEELPPKSAKGIAGQVYQRMMPLAIQDLIDATNQDGPLGAIVGSTGLVGVGVVTYTDETKKARDKAAKEQYGMTWDEVGRQYGRAEQLKLEQKTPAILEAEKEQERRFAAGTPTTMQQWQNEGKSIEETYREAVDLASKEFKETNDGVIFRDKIDTAAKYRRMSYGARAKRKEYQDIVAYYNQPLKPEQISKMNPGDVLRREYYQLMFSPDMYDQYGNYLFDEAEKKEQTFVSKYGQQALDYIDEYRGATWLDKPAELKMLESAREALKPYWDITDRVWAMYPIGLKVISDQIQLIERTDPVTAKQMLRRYPQILRARELIARYKKQIRQYNPAINQMYRLFYG